MERLTQQLIDAALAAGGTYYLPYRLHATPEQLARAYPMIGAFFAEKRRVDPEGIFTNSWYRRYGR
ncbi:MAG TPA: FAD-binding oxidoreductase, partial [Thermoanaerobaculia bacterium]